MLCSAILRSSLVLFMKVYFAKSQHPHCYLAKFGYFAKLNLPLCQNSKLSSPCCHIAMTPFPYRQLHINCYLALWLFCQIANSTSPSALTELVSSCYQIKNSWSVQAWIFSSLPKLLPQKKTYYILPLIFIFLHSLPRAAHLFLPFSLSLSLLTKWLKLKPFQIHITL